MQKLYKGFLFSVCFFLAAPAVAQQPLKGRVVDSAANTGLEGANVKLLTAKDSVVDQRSASTNGKFELKKVPAGQYRLQVNYLGYRSTVVRIRISARSEERRVGQEWVSTCRSRWMTYQ